MPSALLILVPSHPNFRPQLNKETTYIAAHVPGVLGVFEVRGINRKSVPSGQEAQACLVQILPG
jgi:hypothetical protein